MRKKDPEYGSTRIRKGFLFLPKHIDKEWRWLELASWLQTYDGIWMIDTIWLEPKEEHDGFIKL